MRDWASRKRYDDCVTVEDLRPLDELLCSSHGLLERYGGSVAGNQREVSPDPGQHVTIRSQIKCQSYCLCGSTV